MTLSYHLHLHCLSPVWSALLVASFFLSSFYFLKSWTFTTASEVATCWTCQLVYEWSRVPVAGAAPEKRQNIPIDWAHFSILCQVLPLVNKRSESNFCWQFCGCHWKRWYVFVLAVDFCWFWICLSITQSKLRFPEPYSNTNNFGGFFENISPLKFNGTCQADFAEEMAIPVIFFPDMAWEI